MDRLGEELRRELARFGPAAGMAELVRAWPTAVGAAVARNAWPARFGRDGVLHVATSSSAWACELTLLESEMLDRLRTVCEPAPAKLRFVPGPLPEPTVEAAPSDARRAAAPSASDVQWATELTASVDGEEPRTAVARAAALSLARAAADREL